MVERVEEVDEALRVLEVRVLRWRGWACWVGFERRGWRGPKSTGGAREGPWWEVMLPLVRWGWSTKCWTGEYGAGVPCR